MTPTLIVLTGPTAVGKTAFSLALAERYRCSILNADSRQIYRDLPIGTAAPTKEEQTRVRHYFVGTHSLNQTYNAGEFERDCMQVLADLFLQHPVAILSGGSMMYIDAVCNGLDDIPATDIHLREKLQAAYRENGIDWLQQEVQRLDPVYWQTVDRQNPQRLLHCIEVSLTGGKPYSELRSQKNKERPFRILKLALYRPREELYERINNRVEVMMKDGLEAEVRQAVNILYGDARPNADYLPGALNTVGYKEMIRYINGEWNREETIRMIQQNSRHYAKRQLTWFRRDEGVYWLDARVNTDELLLTTEKLLNNE